MVIDDANISNKLIVETVNDYFYESKKDSFNVNVVPIKSTYPPGNNWDHEPREEEWRIAQSIPLHIPTAEYITLNIVKLNTNDLCPMTVLIVCTIQ